MIVRWQVEDDYVGGNRPHETYIDDYDLSLCSSEGERQELIQDLVYEDFLQKVTFEIIEIEEENDE